MSKRQIGATILASALKCKNFGFAKHKKTPIFLEKGSILHEMLENMGVTGLFTYNKKGSEYYGKVTLYVHEHPFSEYEEVIKEYFNDNKDLFVKGIPELKFIKDFNEKYAIRGAIDRTIFNDLKTEVLAIDWKSGQSDVSMVDLDNINSIVQAVVYCWYLFTEYKTLQKATFRWEYIEMGKTRSISFKRSQLQYLKSLIVLYIFNLENGGLKINPSCAFCCNKLTCPLILYPDLTDFTKLEDIELVLAKAKELKQISKTLEEIQVKVKKIAKKKLPPTSKHFGARKYNYLQINDKVPLELKLMLLGDSVRVSKKDLKEYLELFGNDLDIVEKKSETFKL